MTEWEDEPPPWAVDLAARLDRIERALHETHAMAASAAAASGVKVPKAKRLQPPP